jgi:hypothetical protein
LNEVHPWWVILEGSVIIQEHKDQQIVGGTRCRIIQVLGIQYLFCVNGFWIVNETMCLMGMDYMHGHPVVNLDIVIVTPV